MSRWLLKKSAKSSLRHWQISTAMNRGATLWRYSTQRSGWLIEGKSYQRVNGKTIDDMLELETIFEDNEKSIYRESGGSDIHYMTKAQRDQRSLFE